MGHFTVLSLRRDDYLAISSINIHYIYQNTQLRPIYIDVSIVEIEVWTDMLQNQELKRINLRFYFFNVISLTIKDHSNCQYVEKISK